MYRRLFDSIPRRKFEQIVLIAIGPQSYVLSGEKSDVHIDISPPCSVNQRNKDLVNDADTYNSCSSETNKSSCPVDKLYSDKKELPNNISFF